MRSTRSALIAAATAAALLLAMLAVSSDPARGQAQGKGNDDPPGAGRGRPLDPDAIAVRILVGVGDRQVQPWDGRVSVDQGEVVDVEGYRFRKGDELTDRGGWKARSHIIRKVAAKKAAIAKVKGKTPGPSTVGPTVAPNGVIVTLKSPTDAALTLTFDGNRGTVKIPLAELADGSTHAYHDGKVVAQRVPPSAAVLEGDSQDDFPAAVADDQGGVWVAYVHHEPLGAEILESYTERPKSFENLAPKTGGDQLRLLRFAAGKPSTSIDVTLAGRDVWRPAVAVDGKGKVVVAWSEKPAGTGNWDLYERTYDPAAKRLVRDPSAHDGTPAPIPKWSLATAPDGKVWMTWQAWNEGAGQHHPRAARRTRRGPLRIERGGGQRVVAGACRSTSRGGSTSPTTATRAGNYDVWLRTLQPDGRAVVRTVPVARTPKYEARPSLAIDPSGRVWVAYEERTENWGKDAENLVEGRGLDPLSTSRRAGPLRRWRAACSERPTRSAQAPADDRSMNSFPRLACDRSGRLWLAFRHRLEAIWGNQAVMVVGGVWVEYATTLAGPNVERRRGR